MGALRWAGSLRFRLLAATLVALTLALLLAGFFLHRLFQDHVMRQYQATLTQQIDQITARLEFDAAGQPQINAQTLSDPRWLKPYSGLYWQVDRVSADTGARSGVLRSRSLWDTSLVLATDALADGALHVHQAAGPQGASVLMLERTVSTVDQPGARWRLIVAGDLNDATLAVQRFTGVLTASLVGLGLLLVLAALAQVALGLAPLRAMQRALVAVRAGQTQRLQGRFPAEVQPLIDDFNHVLERNAEVVARARTHAGNLAHALKTPLAVLDQAANAQLGRAAGTEAHTLADLVQTQVGSAVGQIDWHLAHARAAATVHLPGQRTAVLPVAAALVRVMQRVHASREVAIELEPAAPDCAFAGEEQDLQDMLGNLLDNACKWARRLVTLRVAQQAGQLTLVVKDDGPGLTASEREAALTRGVRLDESVPGSGLGLAIVDELARLYGGRLKLGTTDTGGLRAELSLPAAPASSHAGV